jgi:hypothetical protein
MPVTGFVFKNKDKLLSLAVSADPYSGTQFYAKNLLKTARINVLNRYSGSLIPLKQESKTIVLEYTKTNPEKSLLI